LIAYRDRYAIPISICGRRRHRHIPHTAAGGLVLVEPEIHTTPTYSAKGTEPPTEE